MTEADSTPQDNNAAEPGRSPFIERVMQASAKNKFLVVIFTIFAVAGGIYGLIHPPLDAMPDLRDAQDIVYAEGEGRSPHLGQGHVPYTVPTVSSVAPNVN